MRNLDEILRFYAISDDDLIKPNELLNKCEQAFKNHVTCFQLRNKMKNYDLALLKDLKSLCDEYKIPLIINDDLNLCIKLEAAGLHIGWDDIDYKIARANLDKNVFIGLSASSYEQAKKSQEFGADYIGIGAIFHTDTKKDAKNLNKNDLKLIMKNISIPKVAIGGINLNNIKDLKAYEIKNVCFVSAIFKGDDIAKNCEDLWKEIMLL